MWEYLYRYDVTVAQPELRNFYLAGLVVLLFAPAIGNRIADAFAAPFWRAIVCRSWVRQTGTAADSQDILTQILLFLQNRHLFRSGLRSSIFTTGVATIGAYEHQFVYAVAVAMITCPLSRRFLGFMLPVCRTIMASIGIFLPVYCYDSVAGFNPSR